MARASLIALMLVSVVALGAPVAGAAGSTYTIDLSHSAFLFRVKHLDIAYTHGRFNEFSGTFQVDEKNPAESSVEISVKVASVDTNDEKRDDHLRSPDFFNVNQFPTMTYKSTAVKKLEGAMWEVTGNLTLHGVTKPVTMKLEKTGEGGDPWGNHRIGFEGTTSIKRSDFGMTNMMKAVGDEIRITVAVEGIRK